MITGAETAHLVNRPVAIFLEGRLPLVEAGDARRLGLQEGQIVKGVIEARAGGWLLNLEGHRLDLPREGPALRWMLGQTLGLRVQTLPDGRVQLRPLSAEAPASGASQPANLPDRLLQLALRPPGLSVLTQLLRPGALEALLAQPSVNMSPEMHNALQQWGRLRASMGTLSAERVQWLMQRSGWAGEHLLQQGQAGGWSDLKTVLRSLMRALQAQGAETAHALRDAVDEIEARQLAAVDGGPSRDPVLAMTLPFVDAHPVHLKWTRPQRDRQSGRSAWTLHLHTEQESLGEIWLQSRILDGQDIDMTMWADREAVVLQARRRSAELADELQSAGLRMVRLDIIHGQGPGELVPWSPPASGSMVDITT